MIIQCQSCAAKYFLPEEKVPVNPLKVRCPKCRAVFMLAGKRERAEAAAAVSAAPQAKVATASAHEVAPVSSPFAASRPVELGADAAPAPSPVASATAEEPRVAETSNASPVFEIEPAPAPAETAPAAEPAKAAGPAKTPRAPKSPDDRAKRLARVLVSDILWYNRERRDAALRDGTLMTSLGEEIKKSWELYKEKVGPEAAHSTNYFKEALNEILADGQQVF